MNHNQILKAYSIKEVSKRIDTPIGTIRQWEKDLNGILVIPRSKNGARYYTEKEIALLQKIKEMREKNVSKNLIRSMLKKHIEGSVPSSESIKITTDSPINEDNPGNEIVTASQNTPNVDDFFTALDKYKTDLLNEIRDTLAINRSEIIDEIRNELSSSSLHTIKELSKSIQRSNDKRKAEFLDMSMVISKASEDTSESFAVLADTITNDSQRSYEQLLKKISDTSKTVARENKNLINRVSKTVTEANNDIKRTAQTLDEKQKELLHTMYELKQSTEEIQHREEIFQGMLKGFREAAASKAKKKKWWQVWS